MNNSRFHGNISRWWHWGVTDVVGCIFSLIWTLMTCDLILIWITRLNTHILTSPPIQESELCKQCVYLLIHPDLTLRNTATEGSWRFCLSVFFCFSSGDLKVGASSLNPTYKKSPWTSASLAQEAKELCRTVRSMMEVDCKWFLLLLLPRPSSSFCSSAVLHATDAKETKLTQHTSCCNRPPHVRPSSGCGPWQALWDTIAINCESSSSLKAGKGSPNIWRLRHRVSICQLWFIMKTSTPDFHLKTLITSWYLKKLLGLKSSAPTLKQEMFVSSEVCQHRIGAVLAFCLCTKLNLNFVNGDVLFFNIIMYMVS